jgi:ribosomal protein S12
MSTRNKADIEQFARAVTRMAAEHKAVIVRAVPQKARRPQSTKRWLQGCRLKIAALEIAAFDSPKD